MKTVEQKVKEAITKLSFSTYSPIFTNLILMTKFKYVSCQELPFALAAVLPKSDGILIYINSDLMENLPVPAITAVLAHEYWHVVNGHCWCPLPNREKDNVAADIEINQSPYVELDKIGCGGSNLDPVFKQYTLTYDKFNLPSGRSREFYYEKLPDQPGNGRGKGKGKGGGGGQSDDRDKNGRGRSGSGQNGPKQGQSGSGQGKIKVDSHDHWNDSDIKNSKEIYKKIVEEILEHVKNKGLLPGDAVEEIKARWAKNRTLEQTLRRIIGKHYRDSLNETVTRTRPSRRNPLVPGTKNSYGPMFVFAIDTSGSMSTEMLEELLSVFKWVTKKFGPTPLIQCDAEVHDLLKDIGHKTMISVKGRGGTDFRPVFKFIEEKFKNKIDVLIFGTDLNGEHPESVPPYKVYWVVPKDAKDDNIKPPFGTVIQL
jgi:predicted metal-dependent peptidase